MGKVMSQPEYKILPCIFCTIGFNCYVAGHKLVSAVTSKNSAAMTTSVENVEKPSSSNSQHVRSEPANMK